MAFKKWVSSPLNKEDAAVLSEACGLHPFLALMLSLRGVTNAAEAVELLNKYCDTYTTRHPGLAAMKQF